MPSRTSRTDLVISMTLAEVFLLLLFVVWHGFSATINNDPVALLKEKVAKLETANSEFDKQLRGAKEKIVDLQWRLDFLHTYLRLPPEFNERNENAGAYVKNACKEECRSSPVCERPDNVLVEASVIHGQISIKVLSSSQHLSAWLAGLGHHYPPVGVPITGGGQIQEFLEDVRSYYSSSSSKVDGKECRFDYRLKWASNDDYHDGRVGFEGYFYPAGITQVSER